MNKTIVVGRLTRDPDIRYSQGENKMAIARYTIAADRRIKKENESNADFIPCVVFGRSAEFAEKYFRRGMRISIAGHIQSGSYINSEGIKIYTLEVVVEEQEFAENKGTNAKGDHRNLTSGNESQYPIADEDDELPFR